MVREVSSVAASGETHLPRKVTYLSSNEIIGLRRKPYVDYIRDYPKIVDLINEIKLGDKCKLTVQGDKTSKTLIGTVLGYVAQKGGISLIVQEDSHQTPYFVTLIEGSDRTGQFWFEEISRDNNTFQIHYGSARGPKVNTIDKLI